MGGGFFVFVAETALRRVSLAGQVTVSVHVVVPRECANNITVGTAVTEHNFVGSLFGNDWPEKAALPYCLELVPSKVPTMFNFFFDAGICV